MAFGNDPSSATSRSSVVLHIGRNKAGSTTIQDFCLAQRAELHVQDVDYVLFGHLADSQPGTPGFSTFEQLSAYMREKPGPRRLVSNEFMFGWPDEFTEAAARALADSDVQVMAYVRPYDDWLISAYAEETRRGMNIRPIDDYGDWLQPRVSAWPHLRKWGECFGWERLRIRDLSPGSLHGRDLLADFQHALGLAPIGHEAAAKNVAPHWIELELIRRLADRNGEVEWAGVSHAVVEPLIAELRPLILETPPAVYLSLSQRRRLRDLYNQDLERIHAAGGPRLPPAAAPSGAERLFIPDLARAPRAVLNAFFERTRRGSFAEAHPEAADSVRGLGRELGFS